MNSNNPPEYVSPFGIKMVTEARNIFEDHSDSITNTLRHIKNKYKLNCKELGNLLDDAYLDEEGEDVFNFYDYGAIMQWCHLSEINEEMEFYINNRLEYLRKRTNK